ncbi:hypothetical protein C3F09_04070 [candidate division GN15 bacterium]|uniref:Uncharacterized protein n=1 Tax=candidate division GN15 bacterium TaxID=2072418 RepID=A0A855X9K6_9BACT|nr:MAG: hypothetical protein C3F09_04070 [candidate division GN15 bacterium]
MPAKKTKTVKVQIKVVDGHCKADPGIVLVRPGETIEFEKKLPGLVFIQISGMWRKPAFTKKKNTARFTLPVSTKVGCYPYAVFCDDNKEFCTGSSMPIIIVPGERDTV